MAPFLGTSFFHFNLNALKLLLRKPSSNFLSDNLYDKRIRLCLALTLLAHIPCLKPKSIAFPTARHGDFAGSGLFTTHCPEAERRLDVP